MAVGFARQLWPNALVRSAGICVDEDGPRVAAHAVAVMRDIFGIDIADHAATRLGEVDLHRFEIIIALDGDVATALSNDYKLSSVNIVTMDIGDPFGADPTEYLVCARDIWKALETLKCGPMLEPFPGLRRRPGTES